MSLLGDSSLFEVVYLSSICYTTKQLMMEYFAKGGKLTDEGVQYLSTSTLPHIDDMQEGFKWTLRATQADLDELRYLLRHAALFDWNSPDTEETSRSRKPIPPDLRKIQALQHARIVLGIMPKMPKSAVTYPYEKSYSDIPAPSGPAELAERIDELERIVWETAMQKALERPNTNSYRRAYGFFDAAVWLAVQHMKMFRRQGQDESEEKGGQLPN